MSQFLLLFSFTMLQHTGVGMGYLHFKMNRSRTITGAGNIIGCLISRSIAGHSLHIQVHQHYGFEFHLVLRDDSCIRRICEMATRARRVCSQLERGLVGLCSCVFDDRRELPFPGKLEPVLGPSLYSIGLGHPVTAIYAGWTVGWWR